MPVGRLFAMIASWLRARKSTVNTFLYFTAVFDSSCLLSSVTLLLSSPRPLLYAASICTSSSAVIIAYAMLFVRSELCSQSYRSEPDESCLSDELILPFIMYLMIAKLLLTLFSVATFMWTNWMIPLEGVGRLKRFVMGLQLSSIFISLFPFALYS